MRVGFYTECYRPIVNGVVASIDALRSGLQQADVEVTTIAPFVPRYQDADPTIVRIASLALPTSTGYRLCVPYVARRDRPIVRAFDVVHAHSPFVTGAMAYARARQNGVPLVFTYHTRLEEYVHYLRLESALARAALVRLTRVFANAADGVIVPTQAMETRLRAIGVVAPIAIVPSAIDVARFAAGRRSAAMRARLGAVGDERLVLAVGRLGREKNHELAIDALAQMGDVRLAIVGGGPRRAALEARAAARGVGARVHFAGGLAPAELPDAYASCDAFVFTSTTETQGLVLAEALAAGAPIVAVDAPSTREVLGEFGRYVEPDPSALARALAPACRAERDLRAVAWVRARFGSELQARRVLDAYRTAREDATRRRERPRRWGPRAAR